MGRKTKADPSGQNSNRNKSTKRLSSRLTAAERRVKELFKSIPRTVRRETPLTNAQETVYEYQFTADDRAELQRSVSFILDDELLETQTDQMPFDWYWKKEVELPYRQGTVEEVRDFNQIIGAAIVAGLLVDGLPPRTIEIELILLSEDYRAGLADVQVRNFTDIKGLSQKTATQVVQRINDGIDAGESPTAIAEDISRRFGVAKSDAKRISVTEINRAYNDAKLKATTMMAAQTGLRSGVVHISALLPTTRPHHAARHGKTYTVAAQMKWWNSGSNRINCKCTVRSVLINDDGEIVFQTDLLEQLRSERSFFDD